MSISYTSKRIALTSAKAGINLLEMTYTITIQVRSTTAIDPIAASQWLAINLPWSLTVYGAPYALLDSFTLEPEGDTATLKIFNGTAVYKQTGTATQQIYTKLSFRENSYEVVRYKALNEDGEEVAITNSAGDRFADPVIEVEKRTVIVVEKVYAPGSTTLAGIDDYRNSVNRNAITIADIPIAPRGALFLNIQPEVRILGSGTYDWIVRTEIEVMPAGGTYDRDVLDQGYYLLEEVDEDALPVDQSSLVKRKDADGEYKYYRRIRIMTQNKETGEPEPTSEPTLLDGLGGRLQDTTVGNEKYITYRTKPERDWAALDLPASIWDVV
jgi:hypothetical protein